MSGAGDKKQKASHFAGSFVLLYNELMKRVLLVFILILILAPISSFASTAGDFTVNNQATYAVPPGTTKLLILDLTLPGIGLTSIKINNGGTVQQYHVSQIAVYEDGLSPGWDGDESERVRKSSSPFWDTELIGDFSKLRIFVTIDITSTTFSGATIKPEIDINSAFFSKSILNGPTDKKIIGLERTILAGTSIPSIPFSPIAKNSEAISTSIIRWHFTDLSNNEFGFKILDSNLKEVVRKEEANLSYIDEIGLAPNTEYPGRKIVAFNDMGENSVSVSSVFPAMKTLAVAKVVGKEEPISVITTTNATTTIDKVVPEPTLFETIQTKIADIQRQINELIKQLNELIKQSAAIVAGALQGFFQSFFEK